MKKFMLFIALLYGVPGLMPAQGVVNAGGNAVVESGVYLVYSIGQPVITNWIPAASEPGGQEALPPSERDVEPADADNSPTAISLRCVPNPAGDWLFVETNHTGFRTYRIFSEDGTLKISDAFDYTPIAIAALRPGPYLLHLTAGEPSFSKTIKFIKQ